MDHMKQVVQGRSAWIAWVFALILAGGMLSRQAAAIVLVPPPNLAQELLSETIPTAFEPFAADAARDFRAEWQGAAPEGVEATLIPGSLQWVRVSDVLVLPRARIRLAGLKDGVIRQAGYASTASSTGLSELSIALLSDPAFVMEIQTQGKTYKLRVFYVGPHRGWFTDSSCSPFWLEAPPLSGEAGTQAGWGYVGCRRVATEGPDHKRPSVQTWWVWNAADARAVPEFEVDGVKVPPLSPGLWGVRFEPDRREARIKTSAGEYLARASVAPKMNFGSFGLGIGPYLYRFSGFGEDINRLAPLLTLYGSYIFTDTVRLTAFSATAMTPQWYTDFGLYVSTESFTAIDRRLSFRLMLGAHIIGFLTTQGYVGRFGAPQGFEAVFYDAFARGRNLGLGGFIYPEIDGKSYYNLWLRWGSWRFFGEINYISWREKFDDGHPYFSRSVGISVGMPMFGFL